MNGDNGNFEEPIVKLRQRIEELSALPDDAAHRREVERLREKLDRLSREIYARLTPWQKTLVARHPLRPYTLDYIGGLLTDFVELKGDRRFAEDFLNLLPSRPAVRAALRPLAPNAVHQVPTRPR